MATYSLPEYINRLNQLAEDLPAWIEEKAVNLATYDLAAMISQRVINTGVNENNSKFTPYSTKTTLVGRSSFTSDEAWEKIAGSKKKRSALDWVTYKGHKLVVLDGGYKKIRELEGREVGHKSFERTGELWGKGGDKGGWGVVAVTSEGGKTKVTLGFKRDKFNEIVEGQNKREGVSIVGATKQEEKEIANLFNESVKEFLSKYI